MANQPDKLTDARQPRGIVKINGVVMPGWLEWETEENIFYQADTFNVVFALSKMPAQYGAAWWMAQQQVSVEILAGFPKDADNIDAGELVSWIYGNVDVIDFDLVANVITLDGRDLTAAMIDTKTTQKWQNLTASAIATQIAQSHGLTPVVTPTSTKAGKYYEIEHARLQHGRSEWDLLTWLAQEEGFVVFVRGQSLYFQPKPDAGSQTPYLIHWQAPDSNNPVPQCNATTLRISRNLTLARDVVVTVKSWNYKQKKGFTKTARAAHRSGSPGTPQTYSYTIPNLTPEQALQKAQALAAEITAHEMLLTASLPADDILDVTGVVQVIGTNTDVDQVYYPDNIRRRMNLDEGYSMHLSAKNHSPESTVTL